MEIEVLPRAVTSVAQLISAAGYECTARHVSREIFGLSPTGRVIHDFRFSMSATGSVSRVASEEVIRSAVSGAAGLALKIDQKVARFLRLAEDEMDALRRFLFFFLAVEVETHRSFGLIDHSADIPGLLDASHPRSALMHSFLKKQPERLKDLKGRFIWCALFAWPGITPVDVEEFVRLKSVRDKLAHGDITEPPWEAVGEIAALAYKLQRHRSRAGGATDDLGRIVGSEDFT